MKRAERLNRLPPYPFARWAQEVAKARANGLDVIRLDIGSPDMAPPDAVVDVMVAVARQSDSHGYATFIGIPELREAIAGYYQRRFDVSLDPASEILPLIGSKEGIVNMAQAILDPGDLVLVPDPGYAPYTMGAMLAGADVVTFPLLADHNFLPDLSAIPQDIAQRAAMMWLNYPNNPTGAVVTKDFLKTAIDFAARYDIMLCFDAPYSDVTYGVYRAPSILELDGAREVAVEFNSLSKTFNMAGWRVGMAVGNADALSALRQVKSNTDSGMGLPVQMAAVRALTIDEDWILERNKIYERRLAALVSGINAAGLKAELPQAALYVWAKLPEGVDAEDYAKTLLHTTGVAIAPGPFFGPAGTGYVRLSATAPDDQITKAIELIKAFRLQTVQ